MTTGRSDKLYVIGPSGEKEEKIKNRLWVFVMNQNFEVHSSKKSSTPTVLKLTILI